MTERDFIVNYIDELVTLFPKIRARYENHSPSNTHFIEVVPNEVYHLNKDYQDWEEHVVFKFIDKFPTQNICFLSDDATVGLEHVDYVATGKLFGTQFSYKEESYQVIEVTHFNTNDSLTPIYQVVSNNPILVYSEVAKSSLIISSSYLPLTNGISTYIDTISPSIEKLGNTQYAMAA